MPVEGQEKVVLNNDNGWRYTFSNLPKYTDYGEEINYSVIEKETNLGDLEYYEEAVITGKNPIIVTNKYKLMNTVIAGEITKQGPDEIATSSTEPVNYTINYKATVEEYIGEALVTIVDYLPYEINEETSNLNGGTYDRNTNTITWKERIDHINTYENGAYAVDITKNITLVYSNLDATQDSMTNRATGTIDLYETEQTNTKETEETTNININGKVIVKYINKETGEEITYKEINESGEEEEKTYGYEIEGKVGQSYETELKEIDNYTYVENTNNTTGRIKEGTIEVIYYYERAQAGGVIVKYVDESYVEIAESETITGKVWDRYETEQKEIEHYDFVRVEGETEGELTKDIIEVTYVYTKIPGRVIVQHLEKDDTPEDDSDNKVLAEEEIIEGYSGDHYTTSRKEIQYYQAAEPEPENKEGEMTRGDIYVKYYYERKESGKVIVKYLDIETKEEIQYVNEETGEYETYREEMQGKCGEKYITEVKEIPYYNYVEEAVPVNGEGIYVEEDIYVNYYYKKQEFNITVDKVITGVTLNGKEEDVLNNKLVKVDVIDYQLESTNLEVSYLITVENTGEIEGTAVVEERIPSYFEVAEGTAEEWGEAADGRMRAEVSLQAGEKKELKVVLKWKRGSGNFGGQNNEVEIVETSNPANYTEIDTEDDKSNAEMVISIKTGKEQVVGLIIVADLMLMVVAIFAYECELYVKSRKNKKTK